MFERECVQSALCFKEPTKLDITGDVHLKISEC
jgi:hypothetical protein